jgi:cytochrome c oxidase assembly protein subunit 15
VSSARAYTIASRLGISTTLAMFGLIVLGSLVRTTGSGLACPDWPLCQGRLIPPFDFNVLLEWSHRTLALFVSLLLFATAVWTALHRELRARLGGLVWLAVGLLFAQVFLGALTVWKLLDPSVVNVHLAVALLLFAALVTFTLIAERHAESAFSSDRAEGQGRATSGAFDGDPARRASPVPESGWATNERALLPILAIATTLTFLQSVLGGAVSSQHAGLACPDWPACNGAWFPPLGTLAGLHMLHRYAAYVLTAVVAVAWYLARRSPDAGVRAGAALSFALLLVQIVIGICNVLLGTPAWLSPLHLATAASMMAFLIATTFRAAALPTRAAAPAYVSVP